MYMKKIFCFCAFVALLGLSSCGDDDPDSKFDDVTLRYEESYAIPNGGGSNWTSSNDLIASVSGSIVKAEHVGVATISSDQGSFEVTVTAKTNTYQDPCLEWRASKSRVKEFMKSYSGVSEYSDDSTGLAYIASKNQAVMMLNYLFESNKLTSSGIVLNTNYVSSEEIVNFLNERYIYVMFDDSDASFYFMSPEEDMAVVMQVNTIGDTVVYIVIYVPMDSSTRANGNIKDLFNVKPVSSVEASQIFEEIKGKLK